MKSALKEIAQVHVGHSFRARLEPAVSGNPVVQMRDLSDEDVLSVDHLQRVAVVDVKDSHLLRRGDLVFRSRGMDMTPALVAQEPPEPTVLSAPLYRVRVLGQKVVLPEYLCWYLHQAEAQIYLASRIKGTAQKMVSKHSVENIPVDVPPLATQLAIVELAALLRREAVLLKDLLEKRHMLVSTQLMQLAKRDH